jgi:hypothetical protein
VATVAYTLGKLLEIAGMLLMPVALYVGIQVPGSQGMVLQLKYLMVGILLFGVGRGLESASGRQE